MAVKPNSTGKKKEKENPAHTNCCWLFDWLAKYSNIISQIQFFILITFGQCSSIIYTHFSFVTVQTLWSQSRSSLEWILSNSNIKSETHIDRCWYLRRVTWDTFYMTEPSAWDWTHMITFRGLGLMFSWPQMCATFVFWCSLLHHLPLCLFRRCVIPNKQAADR